jgi:hypothetical protein
VARVAKKTGCQYIVFNAKAIEQRLYSGMQGFAWPMSRKALAFD